MTWFRKHWPDVIILFFIVLILAGAVLILFGGTRKLFNLSATQAPVQSQQETPQVEEIPLNPAPVVAQEAQTQEETQPENQTQTGTLAPEETQPAPSASASGSETAPEISNAQETQSVPVIPAESSTPSVETTETPSTVQSTTEQSGATSQPTPTPSNVQPEQPAPTPQPAARAITGRTPTKQDFRISAGLYQTEAQAGTIAEKIKALGYPTYVFPSKDDNYVVLIGPFVNRNDADTAVSQIQTVHQNLFVYAPQNPTVNASGEGAATAGTSSSPTSSGTTASSAPTGPMYLQVGAYKRADSAVPAIDQLRSLGFSPSLRTDANGMVRVVVGPFAAGDVPSAQAKLKEAGYTDAFQIR
ncbi:SPOR domain-containing protein [Deinococcus cellulosilyticus]|uniref:SPOR domain-containing protein n=1 Tax=Deinococcus cellulosilyticus (strain DSM 18568 / NBRC 106333 / KACC 11606 / 5516J-15) TaxID=1223518 RepID=A0A511NAE6_DEIC1|nr:SPOR domain-containing protein [Deinococcus cellulosilyticus]GEM49799.1 hypothetical protein DC3_54340 [Deinococcus cellulosilyticus NBRC 106333 = KACC 11606]